MGEGAWLGAAGKQASVRDATASLHLPLGLLACAPGTPRQGAGRGVTPYYPPKIARGKSRYIIIAPGKSIHCRGSRGATLEADPTETLGATQGHPSQQARRGTAAQATAGRGVEGAPVLVFGGELAPLELRLRRQSGADGGGCEDEGGRGQHRGGGRHENGSELSVQVRSCRKGVFFCHGEHPTCLDATQLPHIDELCLRSR